MFLLIVVCPFVLLFWPLCCLFFDLRILIIPLVSPNSSHRGHHQQRPELRLFLIFLDNLAVVLDFLTVQDKYNIHKLSANIKFLCTRYETEQKSSSNVNMFKGQSQTNGTPYMYHFKATKTCIKKSKQE